MNRVHIGLGDRSYDILIEPGCLSDCGNILSKTLNNKKIVIVTDKTVGKLYGKIVKESLSSVFETSLIEIKPGEDSKRIETVMGLCGKFLSFELDRTSAVIALGGGVVGDIAGFAAAIFMRGIQFVQIPTTLLAFCDSSVGGKVGINFVGAKNLIGTFYQPKLVIIDPEVLRSLSKRELISGFTEAVKTGLIGDKELYNIAVKDYKSIIELSQLEILSDIIYRSVKVKADIVTKDERENGLRRVLNFGHTIGHGIEAASAGKVLHGEAVLIGMCCSVWLSNKKGFLGKEEFESIIKNLAQIEIPFDISYMSYSDIFNFIRKDKKVVDNQVRFILLKSAGVPAESLDITDSDMMGSLTFADSLLSKTK